MLAGEEILFGIQNEQCMVRLSSQKMERGMQYTVFHQV